MRYITHSGGNAHSPHTDALLAYREVLRAIVDDTNLSAPEVALAMPFVEYGDDVQRVREHFGTVTHVLVVGIGGSSLGIEALYGAHQDTASARLIVLDTLSSSHSERILRTLDESGARLEDIAVVAISKSGSTTETMANATLLVEALTSRYGAGVEKRIAVITDEGSALDIRAEEAGYPTFRIPALLGGRFSVFSSVGIIPATLLGLDVDEYMRGAREEILRSLDDDTLFTAVHTIASPETSTLDTFVFSADLRTYALWRRQLIAESLGKSPQSGPLPTVSTAADLHSVAQLYLSGPRGIHTDFVICGAAPGTEISDGVFSRIVPHLAHTTLPHVHEALVFGVLAAYSEQGLSYSEYHLEACTPAELGALMARNMLEVLYAAEVLGVDAFNQPHVELYKQHMRAKLASSDTTS